MTEDDEFEACLRDYEEFVEQDCPTLIGWLAKEGVQADTRTVAKFWMWRSELWSASWLTVSQCDRRALMKYWKEWEAEGRELHSLRHP